MTHLLGARGLRESLAVTYAPLHTAVTDLPLQTYRYVPIVTYAPLRTRRYIRAVNTCRYTPAVTLQPCTPAVADLPLHPCRYTPTITLLPLQTCVRVSRSFSSARWIKCCEARRGWGRVRPCVGVWACVCVSVCGHVCASARLCVSVCACGCGHLGGGGRRRRGTVGGRAMWECRAREHGGERRERRGGRPHQRRGVESM